MLNFGYPTTGDWLMLQEVAEDEEKRWECYKHAWAAYKGQLPDALRVDTGEPNDNIKVSKARVIVDTSVSFLFGQDVKFELDAKANTRTDEEAWLDECWDANRKMTTLYKLGVNGAVCGHAFMKIMRPNLLLSEFPRLIVLDPANVAVTWDSEDVERAVEYRIQWKAIDATTRKPINKRQVVTQTGMVWVIKDYVNQPGIMGNKWAQVGPPETWPYSWSPIIDCQNIIVPNEYYGEPDIPEDIIGLNKSINFNYSNSARIIKYQAHQARWGRGFSADEFVLGPGGIMIIDSETGMIDALPPVTDMTGTDTFGQRLQEAIHEASRTPSIATGKLENTGQLSGVALQILYGPLIQKTEAKRRTYGDMLVELNRRLLELGGHGPDNRVSITWAEIVPTDMLAERQALTQDAAMGVVSKATLAQKLGYDWETQQQQMAEEAADSEGGDAKLPTKEEADALAAIFKAIKDGVDAGIDLEAVLKVSGLFTDAQINAIVASQQAEDEADALEAQQRMDAMREGGMINGPQLQPTTTTTGAAGPPANAGPGGGAPGGTQPARS